MSNVGKGEVAEGKKGAKAGLVSKAAQPTGITKPSARPNSRTALGAKDTNKKTLNGATKRPASGSGVGAANPKKRQTSTASSTTLSVKEEAASTENEEPIKKVRSTKVEVEEKAIVEEYSEEEPAEVETKGKSNAAVEVQKPMPMDDEVEDLDADDVGDPLMVSEYVGEIFEYLKKLEVSTLPNAEYMDHQEDLEWKMRGILVDWLIEVHTRFHLLPETLFLAINIIDRFLSTKVVQLDRLQLVGVTAMFIASKYEEVLSPQVTNFKRVADDGFSEAEILSAERFILQALNYDLSYPNPMNFLRRISKADNYDIHTRTVGKYLMEVSLLDHRFMAYLPSHIAAAAMYLARQILVGPEAQWDATLAHYSGYTEEEIMPVFKLLIDYLVRPVTHEAFFKKYASKRFLKGKPLRPALPTCNDTNFTQHQSSRALGPRPMLPSSASEFPNAAHRTTNDTKVTSAYHDCCYFAAGYRIPTDAFLGREQAVE